MVKISLSRRYLSLFVFCCATGFARQQFESGYVALTSGDTLRGLVNYRTPIERQKEILIKFNGDQSARLSISEINSIYFENFDELYYSRNVDVDKKPVSNNKLENNMTKRIERELVLLRVLVGGNVSLLKYLDENNKLHFFYNKNGHTQELNFVRFYYQVNRVKEFEEYKQQLYNLTVDCEKMRSKHSTFSESFFISFFKEYNNCNSSTSYVTKAEGTKLALSFIAGLTYNSLEYIGDDNFSGSTLRYASKLNYTHSLTPVFGLGLDFIPKKTKRFDGLGVNLLYNKTGQFRASNNATDLFITRRDYYLSFSYLKLMLNGKYIIWRRNELKARINIGLGVCYTTSNTYLVTTDNFNGKSKKYSPLIDINRISESGNIGLDFVRKKFTFYIGFGGTYTGASKKRAAMIIYSPTVLLKYSI